MERRGLGRCTGTLMVSLRQCSPANSGRLRLMVWSVAKSSRKFRRALSTVPQKMAWHSSLCLKKCTHGGWRETRPNAVFARTGDRHRNSEHHLTAWLRPDTRAVCSIRYLGLQAVICRRIYPPAFRLPYPPCIPFAETCSSHRADGERDDGVAGGAEVCRWELIPQVAAE